MSALDELRRNCSDDVLALNSDLFAEATAPARKRNKYHATKVEFEGMTFDSKKEFARYRTLQSLVVAAEVRNLRRQVLFELQPAIVDGDGKRQRAITYTADFVYEGRDGKSIIEDVKSGPTAKSESFRVRWRMLLNKFKDDPTVTCVIYT